MECLGNLRAAEKKVLSDVEALLDDVRVIVSGSPQSAEEGVTLLSQLRETSYEDLNQIQHEYLILSAATWLVDNKKAPLNCEWHWNPRQTGGANEPDLCGKCEGRIVVSVEVTTSRRPVGTILGRMATTLLKLEGLPGERYYFVRTEKMGAKAAAIVLAQGFNIAVVALPHVVADL
jgi:hypothetical protein